MMGMEDDDDESAAPVAKKLDEVDQLMNKYDDEEKHDEYLKSPEYKAEQDKKKMKEIEAQ